MAQHYSDPSRETSPTSLPDVETFQANYGTCPGCGALVFGGHYTSPDGKLVADCEDGDEQGIELTERGWFYWFCFPGCLPDSGPMGPFADEAEALKDAREYTDCD